MRVLHVAALPFPSHQGTQVYIRQLCERQRHEVHLVTYAHGIDGAGLSFEHHRSPDFPRSRSLRSGPSWDKPLLDAGLAREAARVAGRIRPDIVHAHHYEGLAASMGIGGVPIVYHAHTLLEPELPMYFEGGAVRALASVSGLAADRWLPRLADHCLAISPHLRDVLIDHGIEEDRVTYVPPAIEEDVDGRGRGDGRSLIYLGNLDGYQGVESMLEGFQGVRERLPDARLRIVTDSGPKRCMDLASRLGIEDAVCIEPHGDFRTVLPRLLASSVAVVPRRIPGGFPIKLLNYLNAGVPVLASVHGAVGLRHGTEVMVYGSRAEMVEHACALLGDEGLAGRIGAGGREYAKRHFTWESALDRIDGIYELLRRRPAALLRKLRRIGTPARS
jgi:glycosyltransferase involved in cell wall biosynthesis